MKNNSKIINIKAGRKTFKHIKIELRNSVELENDNFFNQQ